MATTIVNFDTAPLSFTPQPAKVWTRATWADPWTLRADLIPLEAEWSLAPDVSTATLYRRYGRVMTPGSNAFADLAADTTRGYWVLIEYPPDAGGSGVWYWLGYAESPINARFHPARDGVPASCEQYIPCFGFLRVIEQAFITSSVNVDPADDAQLVRRLGGAIFNEGSRGNRHDQKATITEGSFTSTSAYGFALPDKTDAAFWSTRDIVEHLVAFHLPTATGVKNAIPFAVNGLSFLPDWDRPVIDTHGRDVASILIELLSEDRLLSFGIGAVATAGSPPTISSVSIEPRTTVASELSLPAFVPVPANTSLFEIVNTTDPHTRIDVTRDDSEVVDQVIVEGPPEIGIATFRHEDNPDEASANEFENDWVVADQNAYEDGGRLTAGWAALEQFEKRERNDAVRLKPNLQNVYRRFRFKKDWDGKANTRDVFVQEDGSTYVPYLSSMKVLRRLPLLAGIDYTVDPTTIDESTGQDPIQSIVSLKNPDSGTLVEFTRIGRLSLGFQARLADSIPFTVSAEPNNDNGPKVDLLVHSAPNHAIAGTGYVGNVADVDQERTFGGFHYNTMAATLAVQGDRRPYWRIPDDSAVETLDVVRRKMITLDHPALELVHIAQDTIVGFSDTGTPQTSPGGVLRDPTDIIKSLATMYAQFYTSPRYRMVLRTLRKPTQLAVGGIVSSVSYWGQVDCQVRSIRVSTPLEGRGEPNVEVIAASTLFDPIQQIAEDAPFRAESSGVSQPNKRELAQMRRAERTLGRLGNQFLQFVERDLGIALPRRV